MAGSNVNVFNMSEVTGTLKTISMADSCLDSTPEVKCTANAQPGTSIKSVNIQEATTAPPPQSPSFLITEASHSLEAEDRMTNLVRLSPKSSKASTRSTRSIKSSKTTSTSDLSMKPFETGSIFELQHEHVASAILRALPNDQYNMRFFLDAHKFPSADEIHPPVWKNVITSLRKQRKLAPSMDERQAVDMVRMDAKRTLYTSRRLLQKELVHVENAPRLTIPPMTRSVLTKMDEASAKAAAQKAHRKRAASTQRREKRVQTHIQPRMPIKPSTPPAAKEGANPPPGLLRKLASKLHLTNYLDSKAAASPTNMVAFTHLPRQKSPPPPPSPASPKKRPTSSIGAAAAASHSVKAAEVRACSRRARRRLSTVKENGSVKGARRWPLEKELSLRVSEK